MRWSWAGLVSCAALGCTRPAPPEVPAAPVLDRLTPAAGAADAAPQVTPTPLDTPPPPAAALVFAVPASTPVGEATVVAPASTEPRPAVVAMTLGRPGDPAVATLVDLDKPERDVISCDFSTAPVSEERYQVGRFAAARRDAERLLALLRRRPMRAGETTALGDDTPPAMVGDGGPWHLHRALDQVGAAVTFTLVNTAGSRKAEITIDTARGRALRYRVEIAAGTDLGQGATAGEVVELTYHRAP